MIKYCILFAVLLLVTVNLSALDGVFTGLGAEVNGNSHEGIAYSGGLSLGLDVNRYFALGLKTMISSYSGMMALEQAELIRLYFPLQRPGPFVQAELGAFTFFEDGESYLTFLGGLALGWRFVIGKNWYMEPAVRGGYPFIWGAGISIGLRFPERKMNKENEKEED
jgi:hypothetical protein